MQHHYIDNLDQPIPISSNSCKDVKGRDNWMRKIFSSQMSIHVVITTPVNYIGIHDFIFLKTT